MFRVLICWVVGMILAMTLIAVFNIGSPNSFILAFFFGGLSYIIGDMWEDNREV